MKGTLSQWKFSRENPSADMSSSSQGRNGSEVSLWGDSNEAAGDFINHRPRCGGQNPRGDPSFSFLQRLTWDRRDESKSSLSTVKNPCRAHALAAPLHAGPRRFPRHHNRAALAKKLVGHLGDNRRKHSSATQRKRAPYQRTDAAAGREKPAMSRHPPGRTSATSIPLPFSLA